MFLPIKYIYIVLLLSFSFWANAQIGKADKLFAKAEYFKAIPAYQKAMESKDPEIKKQSLIKLADCYRILNQYHNSAAYYKAAINLGKVPADVYYNYGNVLKSTNNYPEALNYYMFYLEMQPTDKKAINAVKSYQEIKYWLTKPQEYLVKSAENINTKHSEFCPVILNNKLIFISDKQSDFVELTTNNFNGEPYLNVYVSKINDNNLKSPKQYSSKINSVYHDGPVAFSSDGTTLFLTRVNNIIHKKNKDFVNRAKLFIATGKNEKWSTLKPFAYNSDEYSCAHACVNAEGTILYFTSDMPGGFGGKDIWMCKKNGDSWDKPINLGADINTSGDEMFPYIRKDNKLFYSSTGLSGFGGLDIFSAKNINGIWLLNRNESLFLNSTGDDFGVVFVNDSTGYFSSNREGGKGKDDIYTFTYTNKYTNVEGTVLLTENLNNAGKNIKIYLMDNQSKVIDSTRTNDKGYFIFRDLETDKVYMAKVADEEINFTGKARYFLADKTQRIMRITHTEGKNNFVFKNLPIDVNGLPDLYNDDDLNIAGNILFGDNPAKPVINKKVIIKNSFDDVIEETFTSEFGAFAFRNLPLDQNYTLTIEDDDLPDNTKITLTNKSGKEVKVIRLKTNGKYEFKLLAIDKTTMEALSVSDKDLIMALKGFIYDQNKKAIPNAKLTIFDKNTVLQNILTDEKGAFEFKNLSADKNYLFSFDDSENKFTNVTKIYIADARGRIYKEVSRNNNKFEYNLLDIDKSTLGEFSVDDPWLQVLNFKNKNNVPVTITENLIYAYNDYRIDQAGKNILDKVISILQSNLDLNIELSSHTDSRSSDAYNLTLSQKRAKSAVDYIISKGINKNRLKAIGYGETRLLNKCVNDFPCSEEEHAVNRRTEFKIVEIGKL